MALVAMLNTVQIILPDIVIFVSNCIIVNTHLFYCINFSVFINKIMFYYLYCSVSQDSPSSKTIGATINTKSIKHTIE